MNEYAPIKAEKLLPIHLQAATKLACKYIKSSSPVSTYEVKLEDFGITVTFWNSILPIVCVLLSDGRNSFALARGYSTIIYTCLVGVKADDN